MSLFYKYYFVDNQDNFTTKIFPNKITNMGIFIDMSNGYRDVYYHIGFLNTTREGHIFFEEKEDENPIYQKLNGKIDINGIDYQYPGEIPYETPYEY